MKVLIAGGGIAGTSAAHALLAEGIEVEVYEKSGGDREVGAAVMLSPNSTRLFAEIPGLLEQLRGLAVQTAAALRVDARDLSLLYGMRLGLDAEAEFGAPLLHIHRGHLVSALSDALPAGVLRLHTKATGFEQDADGVRLRLADGSVAEGDLLIAADGNRSWFRNTLFPPAPRVFRGGWAHRALVHRGSSSFASELADAKQLLVLARAAHGGLISFAGPEHLNLIVSSVGWDLDLPDGRTNVPVAIDDVLPLVADWDPRMRDLVASAPQFVRWPVYDIEPLHHWSRGRVALLGDAAHGTLPTYGQGASMSIESGFALALALAAFGDDVERGLDWYQALRIPRTRDVQIGSRQLAGTGNEHDDDAAMLAAGVVAPGDPAVSGVGLGIPLDVRALYGYDLREAAASQLAPAI